MAPNNYFDVDNPTPQSHDELDVDYSILPTKQSVIISLIILALFIGIMCLSFLT